MECRFDELKVGELFTFDGLFFKKVGSHPSYPGLECARYWNGYFASGIAFFVGGSYVKRVSWV